MTDKGCKHQPMKAIEELLDLILPTRCALCGALGAALCGACLENFDFHERAVTRDLLIGAAATSFGAKEQRVLHAFKESGQTALVGVLAGPLVVLLSRMLENAEKPLLVPVPSSRENYKKRGYMPTKLIARRLCRESGQACGLTDALTFQRKVADQAHLNSQARRANLVGSMVSDSRVLGRQVILFDDIVTTGSTMLESARAVTMAGGKVIGFLAFAETILKTRSKS